jgi:hypothetical protein
MNSTRYNPPGCYLYSLPSKTTMEIRTPTTKAQQLRGRRVKVEGGRERGRSGAMWRALTRRRTAINTEMVTWISLWDGSFLLKYRSFTQ